MTYPAKVVLRVPIRDAARLEPFVEACIRDGVELIAVVGPGCVEVEDRIDDIVVGDGSDDSRFIVTSSHPDESIEEAVEFASMWTASGDDRVEVVDL